MSQNLRVAALQCSLGGSEKENTEKVTSLVREALKQEAKLILIPELFLGPYFCREEKDEFFAWAKPAENHPTILHFQKIAKEFKAAMPVSFFEKMGPHYYNSIAFVDELGEVQGIYRKAHIPDGPGYEEKFYFRPGGESFKVWQTSFGKVGIGICWDQWYPEVARCLMLAGADILLYPTAIGSEPENPSLNTKDLWQRAMIGHAVSNVVPVVAANRIGTEGGQNFYGHSFISDHRGEKIAELSEDKEGIIYATFDFAEISKNRASFGFFRDRRPELYGALVKSQP
jgi:N-carbamoylputrescine amidase